MSDSCQNNANGCSGSQESNPDFSIKLNESSRVKKVIGIVKTTNNGFKKVFNSPNTIANNNADCISSTFEPGKNRQITKMINALIINFKINFI